MKHNAVSHSVIEERFDHVEQDVEKADSKINNTNYYINTQVTLDD